MRREHWVVTDAYMDAVKVRVMHSFCPVSKSADVGIATFQAKLDKLLATQGKEASSRL